MTERESVDILLVEDNAEDLELILRTLRRNHVANRIQVAEDGARALELLFGGAADGERPVTPKVVFLDLKLPKVSGLEVLARIRADAELASLPVVVVSSSREDPDIRESYRLGANSYVVKPVGFEDFMGAISQLGFYWLILNQQSR